MMLLCCQIASGFTSGTTNGTSESILKCELLSTTITPFEAAIGAYFALMSPPAENRAMSISRSNDVSVNSSTIISTPLHLTFVPAERLEAKQKISLYGKSLSSNTFKNVLPTIPVAPTMAIFTFFIMTSIILSNIYPDML